MPDRSDRLREFSDSLGPQIAVLQMPGTGHDAWTSPDGKMAVRISPDGEIVIRSVIEVDGTPVGWSSMYASPELGLLVAAAIAEKAAIVIAERST
ncbi:hypothetical protein P9990_17720 [Prescottella equi]|uniref:hypothetical protein n=1 Tax=Rhodococcus hoagii TaxID=43767 RepID=UPI002578B742|nr:hypothetical protein [Prescottella equi]WJJ10411.1 hypothetical protein P9990_17720 [Prescottella equi]